MNIVGIIPARGGSKGIPRKNIKILAGKPLVAYTIEAGLRSNFIDRIIVSTEDAEIADVSRKFNAEVIERPVELAQDETKTPPVMIHVVDEIEKQGYIPDIVVLLQPTLPLRDEKIIDAVIKQLINSDNDSVFTAFWVTKSMPLWRRNHNQTLTALYDYHLRPRRQEIHLKEDVFCEDGGVYAIKYDAFRKYHDFIGNNPDIHIINRQLDIDTPEDFLEVEEIILSKGS